MTAALAFFLKYWKWFAIGAAALLLATQTARLHHAKGDLAQARAALTDPATKKTWQSEALAAQRDLATCHTSLKDTTASLDAQNAAVEAQRADSERRAKMLAESLQTARAGRASAEARAAGLLKNPPAGAGACARMEGADRAVLGSLK